ncbi:MAG: phage virion morphogenesis protein [Bacteroidota bacterium]
MPSNQQKINDAFAQISQKMDDLQRILPQILANESVEEVLSNFENESFDGKKWEERKDKSEASRSLLVKHGHLKRSPQVYGFRSNGWKLGSDIPYAAAHNNGLTIKRTARSETFVRERYKKGVKRGSFKKGTTDGQGFSFKAYSFKMPMRRFIGDTIAMRTRLYKVAKQEYLKIFNT